jgi:hypothetical protein
MVRRLWVPVTVVSLFMAGCHAYDPTSGYYGNPLGPGAELQIMTELVVPAGLARVYLQYGKTMGYGAVNQYAPFCYFLMREPLPVVQTIRPGLLRVDSVSLNETEVSRVSPTRVAAAGLFVNSDGRGVIALQSYMRASVDGQPDVYALVCSGAFAAPMEAKPMRLHELRQVFGELIEIRVRAGSMPD